jgi:large subunit ribosomal protein L3
MKSIIGRKMGMTEVFAADGTMYPVTVIEVLPNVVVAKKTKEKDGYEALQIGYEDKAERHTNKCELGIYKKANVSPKEHLYELKGDEIYAKNVGENLTAEIFKAGERVDVIGTTKGHGYSGTIKMYGHTIGPKGHGSGYHRQIGSLANNGRTNNRVIPGKTMSGHWGPEQATVLNATIVESNPEKGYILIKGGVPGQKKSIVLIRSAVLTQFNKPVVKPLLDIPAKEAAEKASAEAAKKAAEEAAAQKAAEEAAAKEVEENAKKEAEAAAEKAKADAEAKKAEEAAKAEAAAKAKARGRKESGRRSAKKAAEKPVEAPKADEKKGE